LIGVWRGGVCWGCGVSEEKQKQQRIHTHMRVMLTRFVAFNNYYNSVEDVDDDDVVNK
jgi:hypothetical protein